MEKIMEMIKKIFLRKIKNKLLLWFMGTKFYSNIVLKFVPFIRFTLYYTSFRGWKYKRGYKLLKKGDIILAKDDNKLTAMLIPGEWTHAVQCIDKGPDVEWECSEMTHYNYTKSTFYDICKESEFVAIYRCTLYDDKYIDDVVVPTCMSFSEAIYDPEFKDVEKAANQIMELKIPALYCSELVYQSDIERRMGASLDDLVGLGRPYISPTGLSLAKNVVKIWDSRGEVEPNWHN